MIRDMSACIPVLITSEQPGTYAPRCTVEFSGFARTNMPFRSVRNLLPSVCGIALQELLDSDGHARVTVNKGSMLLALGVLL